MFTGEWCGPCKTVKPIFEALAKRDGSNPPVSFVLVDTSAGKEIADHFRISAVPTFKFFLEGEQLHEIKGADAGELRTQVDILAMTGYPAHPHTRVRCPTLAKLSPAPILSDQKPNFDAALAKLATFPAMSGSGEVLARFRSATKTFSNASQLSTVEAVELALVARMVMKELDPAQYFPVIDVVRYAALQPVVALNIAERLEDGANLLVWTLQRAAAADLPKATFITLLRLLGNALSHPILAASLLSAPQARGDVTQLLVKALLEDDKSIRTAGSNLAYSISGWLRKQRKPWLDEDAGGSDDLEEFESELVTALLEAVDRENVPEVGKAKSTGVAISAELALCHSSSTRCRTSRGGVPVTLCYRIFGPVGRRSRSKAHTTGKEGCASFQLGGVEADCGDSGAGGMRTLRFLGGAMRLLLQVPVYTFDHGMLSPTQQLLHGRCVRESPIYTTPRKEILYIGHAAIFARSRLKERAKASCRKSLLNCGSLKRCCSSSSACPPSQ